MSHASKNLKGFDNVGDNTLNTLLQDNLVEFFDWALLEKGNFFNIDIPTSGHYGGDKHKLRLVDDPNYDSGQVWEGFRSNWVWQSGLSYQAQPNVIQKMLEDTSGDYPNQERLPGVSGVFVDSIFRPASGVGPHSFHVDYPKGRIVFGSAISSSSDVQSAFSYKWINVVRANNEFFREVQYGSQRADEDFNLAGSGNWSQLAQTRMQLPVIAVETVSRREFEPFQLGGGQYVNTDVLFHVLAEEEYVRDKLLDIVSLQNEKTINVFDSDKVEEWQTKAFPLDWRGMTRPSGLRYPELVDDFRSTKVLNGSLRFKDTAITAASTINPNLYHGVVRTSTEVVLPGI
jgi:hypothetical protein